jgi:hypothetical protein
MKTNLTLPPVITSLALLVRRFSVSSAGFLAKILAFFIWSDSSGIFKFHDPLVMRALKVLLFMISYKRQRSNVPTPK